MRLMQKLPEHLKTIVQFAILTGLRMSNITQLKWSQIDLPKKLAWVNSDESKTGNSIGNTFICTARTWLMEQNRYCTKICTPIY
ncbi:tyrosine-type recombinase/integrase [Mergibacter septicus]|uniref:tyrosine-type recombinase/integrase n=1 Tax=Mergibacter septicus TaxID=221402 RepID=UPI002AD26C4A|nr:tyrosine-type recombinase/integrase [Mergibacter septicus]